MSRSLLHRGRRWHSRCFLTLPVQAQTVETVIVTAAPGRGAKRHPDPDRRIDLHHHGRGHPESAGRRMPLNSVILQAPGVAQDSFGQLHIRGEHNGLQYRINGIILPEGISVFGQTLDPRLAQSVRLITGALPAEYGDRTAGVIDIQTKTGLFEGWRRDRASMAAATARFNPSIIAMAAQAVRFQLFRLRRHHDRYASCREPGRQPVTPGTTAPASTTCSASPRTFWTRTAARITAVASRLQRDLPDSRPRRAGVVSLRSVTGIVGLGPLDLEQRRLCAAGQYHDGVPVGTPLDERTPARDHRLRHPVLSALRRRAGHPDLAVRALLHAVLHAGRRMSATFSLLRRLGPDHRLQARRRLWCVQAERAPGIWPQTATRCGFGLLYQADDIFSATSSLVLPTAPGGLPAPNPNPLCTDPTQTCQTSDTPLAIADNGTKHAWAYGLYIQDEWKIFPRLTLNYGVRYDQYWRVRHREPALAPAPTWCGRRPGRHHRIHIGFARYFSPPPIELVAATEIRPVRRHERGGRPYRRRTPKAERADYYDARRRAGTDGRIAGGARRLLQRRRTIWSTKASSGRRSSSPPSTTKPGGSTAPSSRSITGPMTSLAYVNTAYERADGQDIVSSQFEFSPGRPRLYRQPLYPAGSPADRHPLGRRVSYTWEGARSVLRPTCSLARACAAMAPPRMAITCRPTSRSISASAIPSMLPGLKRPDGAKLDLIKCLRPEIRNPATAQGWA